MEYKIGEIFEYNGEWYQCLETNYCSCNYCSCNYCDFGELGGCDNIACGSGERNDNKEVHFKKLEKVGEPYEYFVQHKGIVMLQPYKLFTTPFINEAVCNVHYDTNTIDLEIKQNKEDMGEEKDIKPYDKYFSNGTVSNTDNLPKSNLKPFNLEAAKAGKLVCTRDGRKARIICFDAEGNKPLIVLSKINGKEVILRYTEKGQSDNFHSSTPREDDLMILPEKKEGWAKVRKDINLYDTKEEADRKMIGNDEYVTAKVYWEE